MRRVAVVAAVAGLGLAPAADAHLGGAEKRARLRCDQHHVEACILRAAIHRGQSASYMRSVAYCESRLNPYAFNASSGATGLFQFLASTWATTPERRHPRTSAKWSALAAAWMWQHGRIHEWSCA